MEEQKNSELEFLLYIVTHQCIQELKSFISNLSNLPSEDKNILSFDPVKGVPSYLLSDLKALEDKLQSLDLAHFSNKKPPYVDHTRVDDINNLFNEAQKKLTFFGLNVKSLNAIRECIKRFKLLSSDSQNRGTTIGMKLEVRDVKNIASSDIISKKTQ